MGCFGSRPSPPPEVAPEEKEDEQGVAFDGDILLPSGSRRPSYWRNQSSSLEAGFDDKYDESVDCHVFLENMFKKCSSAEDPSRYKLEKVLRIEDSVMWQRYQAAKGGIRERRGGKCVAPMDIPEVSRGQVTTKALIRSSADSDESASRFLENLDLQINEHYLWHGTSKGAWKAIAEDGFLFDESTAHSGRYGAGIYFAEDSAKSLEYCQEKDGTTFETKCMLLCRVLCGEFHVTNEIADDNAVAVAKALELDALLGNPSDGAAREFVVFDPARVYPEYALIIKSTTLEEPPSSVLPSPST